jgi:hypothetical protein
MYTHNEITVGQSKGETKLPLVIVKIRNSAEHIVILITNARV